MMTDSPDTIISRRLNPPAQINQGLRDGIECLLEIAAMERPVGSRELARHLKQDHTRVNRIISTLAFMGLAEQTTDRKYIPGPGLLVLAGLSLRSSPLYRCAMPHLEELGIATGYQIALGLRWRTNVCYLYHGHAQEHAALGIASEGLYPADRSSIGLMLLSQLPPRELKALYQGSPAGLLQHPDMKTLIERVRDARAAGYAIAPNGRSIAVALGQPAVAGIALYRSEDEEELPQDKRSVGRVVKQLNDTAERILLDMARV
jgi:DNA-binding IclR family transcriptional regulator